MTLPNVKVSARGAIGERFSSERNQLFPHSRAARVYAYLRGRM
jgi:hypothetical protein